MNAMYDKILDDLREKDQGSSGADGMPVEALTDAASVAIPAGGKAYTLTIGQNTTITFPTPGSSSCYFWLYLITGATEYTITLPVVSWNDGTGPNTSTVNTLYRLAFLWDAPTQKWLGSEFWEPEALS